MFDSMLIELEVCFVIILLIFNNLSAVFFSRTEVNETQGYAISRYTGSPGFQLRNS